MFFGKERRLRKLKFQRARTVARIIAIRNLVELKRSIYKSQENELVKLEGKKGELDSRIDELEKEIDSKIAKRMGIKL